MPASAQQALFLHGWAANRHVFDDFLPRLPEFHCHAPDLPGHGEAAFGGTFDAKRIADDLAADITVPQHVFGWSLGGYIALLLAIRHPHAVRSLTLCASFARYGAAEDYAAGVVNPPTAKMADLFAQDFTHHMTQFLHLQSLYAPETQPRFQALAAKLTANGMPSALYAAQAAVLESDVRALLPEIRQPVLLLFARKDRVTPPSMGEYLQQHLTHAELHLLTRSAHMPFVSEAENCAELVRDFWCRAGK
ncbi:MAG: alpha/beta fold hydrolase [Neisseria sp.]|nr:alpha/beta fold hydrolase [Neisseria sp.]